MNLATCLLTAVLLFTPAVKQEPNPFLTTVKAKLKTSRSTIRDAGHRKSESREREGV